MPITRMSTKGQVVIPAQIRAALALDKDAALEVGLADGIITLTPVADDDWATLRGSLAGRPLTHDLERERRAERRRDQRHTVRGTAA